MLHTLTSLHARVLSGALALSLLSVAGGAQTEHGGRPPSLQRPLRLPTPSARMQPVRADLLEAEDHAAEASGVRGGGLRFAEVLPVELSLADSGVWEELGRGARVWRLRISSPGAKSLSLVFSRYHLPQGGELYVYDDAHREVRGAYTDLENRLDGQFSVRPLRGGALTLEYYEPASARGQGELSLSHVAHDYRDVLSLIEDRNGGGGGVAGNCQLDPACPLGVGWGNQVNAAVHIQSIQGGVLCSGSLLNNTSGDGSLLVLSAEHCGGLSTAIFTFNFERPLCRDGVAPCTNVLTGAVQLVRDEDLDIQLARVNAPQSGQPF